MIRRVDRRGANYLDRHGVPCRPSQEETELLACPIRAGSSVTNPAYVLRSIRMYSMHEALARERMREQREQATRQRLSQHVAAARRWQRLAAFSARRAARSRRQLADHAASDFQLVG